MARAYSDDLRKKFLLAHRSGKGTLIELSDRFGVSLSWAWKVSSAERRTGSTARTPQRRHGPESKVDRELLRKLVQKQPDIILRELRAELAQRKVQASIATISNTLLRMGLKLKKSRSMPVSETPQPINKSVKTSLPSSARSRRKT